MLNSQAANSMRTLPRNRFIVFGAIASAAAACAHCYQFILQWRFLSRAVELGVLRSPFVAWLQISFVLAFIITAIGLLLRRTSGLMLAVMGLLVVLVNYATWYAWSYRNLHIIRERSFYREHPEHVPASMLGLLGGTWWDFLILFVTLTILVYIIRELSIRKHHALHS